ncbi:MAG: tetratricopeptide repeat protein [Candidatus Electryonea clarkiae]|nr:tetratricopeptide repeat protein [Candidatus Electryonea clarkiae]MDP8286585.1 tetratricopeptide repeat protein [Candidatus Electryonea clarkiae]
MIYSKRRYSSFKIIIFVNLILALVYLTSAVGGTIEDIAREGDTAYREGNYSAAIEAYSKILESGYTSGAVLFNLGNAHFKAGHLGLAILNYERALKVMPHNRDVRNNLIFANNRTVDRIEQPPRLPVWDWIDALRDMIAPSSLAWIAWSFATIAVIFYGASLFSRRFKLQKPLRIATIISSSMFIFLLLLLFLRISKENSPPGAVILTDKVVVHSAPDPGSSEVFHLHEGTKVTVLKELEGYREIRLIDGRQGWLHRSVCEII